MEAPVPAGIGGYSDGLYGDGVRLHATAAFGTTSPNIPIPTDLGSIVPGMSVFNLTIGPVADPTTDPPLVGVVASYDPVTGTLVLEANAAIASVGASDWLVVGAYSEPRASGLLPIDVLPNALEPRPSFGQILLAMRRTPTGVCCSGTPAAAAPGVPPAAMTEVTSSDTGTGVAPAR